MRRCPLVLPLVLLIAACSQGPRSSSGTDAFDVHVLSALRTRDLNDFVRNFPATAEPPAAEVNASYNLPSAADDPATFTVLINRKRHVIWLRRTAPDGAAVYGPVAVNPNQ